MTGAHNSNGTLYMIPVPLIDWTQDEDRTTAALQTLSPPVSAVTQTLQHFVVENAKTARSIIKAYGHQTPIAQLNILQMPREPKEADIAPVLQLLAQGNNVGVLSEAGCPGIADPGALYVAAAHAAGVPVTPLVGPSSLLLALMASGLNGQQFAFHGYAPVDAAQRLKTLQAWEQHSRRAQQTQLLIETPYRNAAMHSALLEALHANTRLCVACEVTAPDQWIKTKTIGEWKKSPPPPFDKRPTVFCFLA